MTLNKIAQHIRKAIGALMPVDPEKERVIQALLERLEDHNQWRKDGYETVKHRDLNIKTSDHWIENPESVRIPYRWRSHIQQHIDVIIRNDKVALLNFAHDVISGRYVYQTLLNDDKILYRDWLNENARSDEYIIKSGWLYISDETVAMAFKLTFE